MSLAAMRKRTVRIILQRRCGSVLLEFAALFYSGAVVACIILQRRCGSVLLSF